MSHIGKNGVGKERSRKQKPYPAGQPMRCLKKNECPRRDYINNIRRDRHGNTLGWRHPIMIWLRSGDGR